MGPQGSIFFISNQESKTNEKMIGYIAIVGISTLVGMFISGRLKNVFRKHGNVAMSNGMTGAQVAATMLKYYNIHDVKIVPRRGMLTDHYNPLTKTIALSEPVYGSRSISAGAVAAHECGHAIQHATGYKAMHVRSLMVPFIQLSARIQQLLFMTIIFGVGANILNTFWGLGILTATFGSTALFALVTLPVEFDASKRALDWLDDTDVMQDGPEYDGACEGLKWAAMTYVANAMSALVIFLYFGWNMMNRRNSGPVV